jgi:bifunctional DNA-binding transcriptional regulator/antitoxin component of YhaV-PrlF toxin-antitoxin module
MDGTLEMDKFGRVLLPKKLRTALHLQPGGKLRFHLEGERLTVMSEPVQATVRIENGFPVIEFPGEVDFSGDAVTEARAERERELLERLTETW